MIPIFEGLKDNVAKISTLQSAASKLLLGCLALLLLAGQASLVSANDTVAAHVDEHLLRESLSLKGDWRFMPGDDMAWASPTYSDAEWEVRRVPGRWERPGYPEFNHMAWYRLTIQLDSNLVASDQVKSLAIRTGKVMSAFELYAGGELVGKVGQLPPLGDINYDRQRVFVIPASAVDAHGRVVLAMRVWGGPEPLVNAWSAGPSGGEFRFGEFAPLLLKGVVGELPGLLFAVLIFAFGLYHLYIYAQNKVLVSYLWFGLASMVIALYGLMLTQWKFMLGLDFGTLKKIEFGAIYLFPALGIQLVWAVLKIGVPPWLRMVQVAFVMFSAAVMLIPGQNVNFYTLHYEQFLALGVVAYTVYVILAETRRGNPEARSVAVGTFIFMATCVNDVTIDLFHIETPRLSPVGFVAILLAMAVSMARSYTSMHSELEAQVADRTAELSDANEKLMRAASIDHLTGLLNRRGFTDEVSQEISRSQRSGKQFSIVISDVDHFKQFNDQYGHACGDHVLRRVGELMRDRTRDVDRVARWGGEEFILMLPETDSEGAAVLAEKLRETIADNVFEYGGERLSLTMTFGVAEYRKGETLDACVARADTALYHGKERGRNKVMIGNYKGLTLVG
ncbi:hypothetical protein BST95_00265 [Halioglobus japonicus]|uniref:diguanylate cyclase n=1 Tax=Halioglobus japonicus TaxID=930805 RepID=A0AAP8SM80_9GAMM|nr:hypothetical protein BST95_00265 [Halioglobus japonicus]PLW84768.1 hypothetical protein C0029_17360 [Halioglobus japonicus]GHD21320.1 hypothetical protein GCM10007052_31970 [Halioglobus japonicus]